MDTIRLRKCFYLILFYLVLFCVGSHVHAAQLPNGSSRGGGEPSKTTQPLQVYILAGQSNMEGQAKIETFDYIGDDPATAPMLEMMIDADGSPRVCDNVWISYFTGLGDNNGEGFGKLTTGYGSRSKPSENGGKIGPEFTFGLYMSQSTDAPILIIKTAWGGKSLHTDFRPPSAGPYKLNSYQEKLYNGPTGHGVPENLEQWKAERKAATSKYYRLMIQHVASVLKDPGRVCPKYDPKQGYELAGFVWFQGWNDYVDGHTYPNSHQPGGYDQYSKLMAHFIRDVRKDLATPKLPFVILAMGVGGPIDPSEGNQQMKHFRDAMAAPATMPEFAGTVVAVQTAPYWDQPLGAVEKKLNQVKQMAYFLRSKHKDHANQDGKMTNQQQQEYLKEFRANLITPEDEALWQRGASNAGYHYLGCGKTMALIGKAFAGAMLTMEQK